MISKIQLIKAADKIFGSIAVSVSTLLVHPKEVTSKDISNILIIRPGGIGDAVLLIPAVKILKKYFPDTNIDILAEKRNAGIFKTSPLVDNTYLYDDLKNNGLFTVLNNRYQVVIDTEQWHRLTAVVAYLTKAPVRIGYSTNGRSGLYSKSVAYKQPDYEAMSFINLVSVLTERKHRFNTNGGFLKIDKKIGNNEFKEYRARFNKIVGIFTGATVKERRWGINKFSVLAEYLISYNIGVVILGGNNDVPDADKICRILGSKDYLNLTGKTSLHETTSIISNIDLLVSSDSGLMHIAYGAGTSSLSLFGAGIEEKWAPKGPDNHVINKHLACSPCTKFGYTPKCPINVKCLTEISADEVCSKVMEILKS